MDILAIIFFSVAIACIILFFISIFDYNFSGSFTFMAFIIGIVCLVLSYNLMKIDVDRDNKKFNTAIETKTYQSTVTELQGVYKDKIVAGDKDYKIDLKYSETKDTSELKPSDPIKITYVPKYYGGNVVIKIEKLTK
jgi:hypothetical protein